MKHTVSVIIPVYNKEKYIEQCLETVINQTYSNLEIIIIDDASTDNSMDIARSIKDERIKDKIMVVTSEEVPLIKGKVGSISYVPSVAGIYITSYIINDLIRS